VPPSVPALAIAAMAKLGCINPPAAAASIIYLLGNAKVSYAAAACIVACALAHIATKHRCVILCW
jgi:CBS-domain-containing membrane protein